MVGPKPLRLKIISMGNAEVGKSCLIKRYCEKRFVSKYMTTIGIDFGVTKVRVKDRDLKINIFDMAGHPVFYDVRNEFYKDTQGVLLVYNVNQRESFEALELWLEEMRTEMGSASEMANVVFVVCGNKTDKGKSRMVEETEGRLWSQGKGFYFFETSALTGDGVFQMFQTLFEAIIGALENGGKPVPVESTLGYTKEQAEAIHKIKNAKDNYERLGLRPGASSEEINRAYRKLSLLLHPDKSVAPGSEEAFKQLGLARTALLQQF